MRRMVVYRYMHAFIVGNIFTLILLILIQYAGNVESTLWHGNNVILVGAK
jgi:hypothetical protein